MTSINNNIPTRTNYVKIPEYCKAIEECRKLIRQAQDARERGELSDEGYENVVRPLYEKWGIQKNI